MKIDDEQVHLDMENKLAEYLAKKMLEQYEFKATEALCKEIDKHLEFIFPESHKFEVSLDSEGGVMKIYVERPIIGRPNSHHEEYYEIPCEALEDRVPVAMRGSEPNL